MPSASELEDSEGCSMGESGNDEDWGWYVGNDIDRPEVAPFEGAPLVSLVDPIRLSMHPSRRLTAMSVSAANFTSGLLPPSATLPHRARAVQSFSSLVRAAWAYAYATEVHRVDIRQRGVSSRSRIAGAWRPLRRRPDRRVKR